MTPTLTSFARFVPRNPFNMFVPYISSIKFDLPPTKKNGWRFTTRDLSWNQPDPIPFMEDKNAPESSEKKFSSDIYRHIHMSHIVTYIGTYVIYIYTEGSHVC